MNITRFAFPAILACVSLTATAQNNMTPEFIDPAPGANTIISRISDNGKWGISQQKAKEDGPIAPSGGTIYNLETLKQEDISHSSGLSGVGDISDDGNIVVGEAMNLPAYWTRGEGWKTLSLPDGYISGRLNSVTADGRIAVGYVSPQDIYQAYPVAYDLTTGKLIDMPGLPVKDMQNEVSKQNVLTEISADGRYVLGALSQSYLLPVALCTYVYDMQEHTYKIVGFKENLEAPAKPMGSWIPLASNLIFCDAASMSCNGEWVTGFAYVSVPISGSEFSNEYNATFRYNVKTDTFELYPESDYGGFAITDTGNVLAVSPAVNPYSFCYVRNGEYFIGFSQIFSQVYGVDFKKETGFENTGKPISISADGKTMVMLVSTDDCYILRLKESILEASDKVNLLKDFTVDPAEGSVISSFARFTLQFDRDVVANGTQASKITFAADDGSVSYTPLSSNGFASDGKKVTVSFRPRDLEKGKNYTLTIPAGAIYMKGNQKYVNEEIKLHYVGRDKSPVEMTAAYPKEGSAVALLDLTDNPVIFTFDADVKLSAAPLAYLYRKGDSTPICNLNVLASKNQILCYPVTQQRLAEGNDYEIVVPGATVTDINGNGANEEFRVEYKGAFVYTLPEDPNHLFIDDCSTYNNFMFYEGDHLQPASTPAAWGFTKDTTPWYIVRGSNESNDFAFASHSMYNPAGKADDWAVIPRLFIPDDKCILMFDGQGYISGMNDRLKVYILEENNRYNTVNENFANRIRTEGKLIFNEVLDPGATQEGLDGEWTPYTVDLAEYAGKNVYIAFVNENEAASAIFIDNVRVRHETDYLVTVENPERVVRQSGIDIYGTVFVSSEINTFKSVRLELLDASRNVIDVIEDNNVDLKKDDRYKFRFGKQLPLASGVVNDYYINARLGDVESSLQGSVRNLSFQPDKKVVIEEYTGRDCGNCPMGYLAFDYINERFPGQTIPVAIRTYQSDPLGTGMATYSQYLGLDNAGAPSARVNRNTLITYPMINSADGYKFTGAGIIGDDGKEEQLWFDHVAAELAEPADIAIEFKSDFDENTRKINVDLQVLSAINSDNNNINVFAVVRENNLDAAYQVNYYSEIEHPALGEWGKGGKYGSHYVIPFTVNDVARGTWGTSYNGTAGLIPQTLSSSQMISNEISVPMPDAVKDVNNSDIVVMLIDPVTYKVLNANVAAIGARTANYDFTGVDSAIADNGGISVSVAGGELIVSGAGELSAQVYTLTGATIAAGYGNDSISLDLRGYQGIAIVNVVAADGQRVAKKVFIR